MATKTIGWLYTTGDNLYYRIVRDSDGKVLDFADNTFKTLATTATMHVAMPSVASIGGGDSRFAASLDLADINATTTPIDVTVVVYKRLGGSIVLADDVWLGQMAITIVSGDISTVSGGEQGAFIDISANLTTILGTSMHFTAALYTQDGRLVDLATLDPAATCELVVTMDADTDGGERFPIFTMDATACGVVNSSNKFEIEYAGPNLTSNRGFAVTGTITTGGVAYTAQRVPCVFNT